ncbi:MAG: PH domain-containing protein [Clostridia bacterium]|nr:PH domain-containing protein [Clostridia bacterium]
MIDFNNASFIKLNMVGNDAFSSQIMPILIDGETILSSYKGIRDGVVFTNKRIIAINVQGITGKKKDFTSMPYSKIQVYSVETSGVFDMDSELELWFSGVGKVKFEFTSNSNVSEICKSISNFVLK